MKNKINYILKPLLFFAFLGLNSCGEDFFNSVVEIDIPEHKPTLVVAAYWLSGSDSLAVFVSKSRGANDSTPSVLKKNANNFDIVLNYDTIANSKVELFRNDQLLGEIPYYNNGFHLSKGKFSLDTISGVTYKIRVSAPNFPTVEATQVTHARPVVLQSIFKKDGAIYKDPDDPFSEPRKGDEFSVVIEDTKNAENYYSISRQRYGYITLDTEIKQGNQTYIQEIYARNIDPLVENGFLSDKAFKNGTHRWQLFLDGYYNNPNTEIKTFYSVWSYDRDWFLFNKSLEALSQANDNPFFTEPIILHTNIKGGQGIFSIASKRDLVFTIRK